MSRRWFRGFLVVVMMAAPLVITCNRRHDEADFLPTAPDVSDALVVTVDDASIPADGFSTTRIQAQIDPLADDDRQTLRFETNLGEFVEGDDVTALRTKLRGTESAAQPTTRVDKQADNQGRASVFLRAGTATGVAIVTVQVTDGKESGPAVFTTRTVEVEFAQVELPIALVISPAAGVADGLTPVVLEAEIDADAPPAWNQVEFSSSVGMIDGKESPQVVVTDSRRIARAQLTHTASDTVRVTAKIVEFPEATVTEFVDFEQVQGAIESLTASPGSAFADGVSSVALEARISADAPPEWNQITFSTTLATLDQTTPVPTDSQRIARALLSSTAVGTATVTAVITAFPSATATIQVPFTERNPDSIRISVSASTVPADGVSEISVFADIDSGIDDRSIEFASSAGTLVGENPATADAGNRATVQLRADSQIRTNVLVTATVELASGTSQSDDVSVDFIRASPDQIDLSIDDVQIDRAADMTADVTVRLLRDIGTVSPNTEVRYEILRQSDETAITDMFFSNVTLSTVVGGVQQSTATLVVEDSAFTGLAIVRASVPGSSASPADEVVTID